LGEQGETGQHDNQASAQPRGGKSGSTHCSTPHHCIERLSLNDVTQASPTTRQDNRKHPARHTCISAVRIEQCARKKKMKKLLEKVAQQLMHTARISGDR